jgi:hypothetical protein
MMDERKEAAHRAASDAEQIAWVDEQDNLLGAWCGPICVSAG